MTLQMRLGPHDGAVARRMSEWQDGGAAERLWAADHTLWTEQPEPEIDDRLGWLLLPEAMQNEVPGLLAFADEVRGSGITDVVLLGMGGSSLAPEVFQRTFGNRPGYPTLTVLDSTHPVAVASVGESIDPATTLFVVASKSGTTIEPLSFLEFFWNRVSAVTGTPGEHFVAITDPGSLLQDLASDRGFRRTFTATPDVGGRYSALTHFGTVPAALIGADIGAMLDAAVAMSAAARAGGAGFPLGAALGELAIAGRDKATFLTSETLAAFPAWVEQLIAESTGKDGKGILPVADEAPGPAAVYGADRVFVSLTLDSDDHASLDSAVDALEAAGHPVIRITIDRPEALIRSINPTYRPPKPSPNRRWRASRLQATSPRCPPTVRNCPAPSEHSSNRPPPATTWRSRHSSRQHSPPPMPSRGSGTWPGDGSPSQPPLDSAPGSCTPPANYTRAVPPPGCSCRSSTTLPLTSKSPEPGIRSAT